ncbi:MAG: MauE/DoxX family redox-associated membrane protein [Thermodesulfobacteriota bacterium]
MMDWTTLTNVLINYPYIIVSGLLLLAVLILAATGNSRLIRAFWSNPYSSAAFRLFLGVSFIVASMTKIPYPAEFAENVAGFMMVPTWGVNLMGVLMPWAEMVAGLFLILGIRTRAAATIIGALLVAFIIGLTLNLVKGTPINCGCFESIGEPISWELVVRDVLMLVMAVQILLYDRLFVFDRGGFIWRERKI